MKAIALSYGNALSRVVCFNALLVLLSHPAADASGAEISPKLDADHEVLTKLASLGTNQAAYLGRAKVVGEFNEVAYRFDLDRTGPLARDYSIKMVWAPDRGRALFAGANHGRPHRLNDVWEFDLGALSWILLYPPDNPRSYSGLGDAADDVIFDDGILRTKRGGPVVIGHSWWGISYDSTNSLFLFMSTWDTNQKAAIEALGGDPSERYLGPPMWTFDPQTKIWKAIKAEKPYPRAPFGGLLEYIPDYAGTIWHANHWQMRATWLFKTNESTWTRVSSSSDSAGFIREAPRPEQVGYYDTARKMLVAQRGNDTFHFKVNEGAWSKILSKPDHANAWPSGHDAYTPFYYSPKSGKGVFVDFRVNEIWTYEPSESRWRKLEPEGPPMPRGSLRLAYFDAKHDVLVVIDGVEIWVCRLD